ncbi:hypothetical protein KR074_007729, partial [Drosophila pseudoananassae]
LAVAVIVIIATDLPEASDEKKLFSYGYLVLGAATILVCLVGFVGALKGHICTTWVYAILLLILLILTIVPLCLKFDAHSIALKALNRAWVKEINGTDGMSLYQEKFKCCGILGPIDYRNAKLSLPKSCFFQNNTVFPRGCLAKMKDLYNEGLDTLMLAGWIFFAIQV